ncbi:MAG: diaminopimelate epimerase, partial [Polyangiales bacterium]
MRLPFTKYEGLGNDFLIVEAEHAAGGLGSELVARLCDRHLGVGGDGVLLLHTNGGRYRMQVTNADGSVPEMCGNGIRCVALHLSRLGRVRGERFEIDTDAGPHACRVLQ